MSSQFSSSAQEAIIDAGLNGFLVTSSLLGIYTMVYFGTLYIYLSRRASKPWVVLSTISILYLAYVIQTAVQWFQVKQAFVENGATRETVFVALGISATWVTFVDDVCNFLMAIVADGLLIWRCFTVWNQSILVIILPSLILFCQIAIDISVIVISCASDFYPSDTQGHIIAVLLGTSLFTSLATSLVATFLISYRIHSFVAQGLPRGSIRRINHVLEVLVQSAAIYSVVSLANAVTTVIPYTSSNEVRLYAAQAYVWPIYIFTAGVGPTIMVARVAFATDGDKSISASAVTHIPGLQFRQSKTQRTTGDEETGDILQTRRYSRSRVLHSTSGQVEKSS